MIIDTHGHYDDKKYDKDRDELLRGLKANGVEAVINSGADFEGCLDTVKLTQEYSFVYGTLGIHPSETGEMTEETIEWLHQNSARSKIVAIGEIGLDYYWEEPEHDVQQRWFRRQLELAKEVSLPIVIHSRDAAEDTMRILKEADAGKNGGSIHCFSYSKEMALEYIKMGFYIGVGGVVTFKNARKLKETVEAIPLERILLETDCPYLAPEPNRGTRNDSTNLIYVAEEIARIRGISSDEVIQKTAENARQLYGL